MLSCNNTKSMICMPEIVMRRGTHYNEMNNVERSSINSQQFLHIMHTVFLRINLAPLH